MAILLKVPSRYISLTASLSVRKPVFSRDLPKRPASAFGLFVKEAFYKNGHVTDAPSRLKELSELWKSMEEVEKQVYFDKYSDLKSEYNSNKDMFISNMDDSDRKEYQRYLRDCRKYTREKKRKKEGDDPFPRKLSGFNVYIREKMHGRIWNTISGVKHGFAEVAQDWNNMSSEDKKVYNDKGELIYRERLSQYYQRNPEKAE